MGITAHSGPTLNFGVTVKNSTDGITGVSAEYNDQRAPSVNDLGTAMMDPRAAYGYSPGNPVTAKTYAFYNGRGYVDYTPTAASSVAIVNTTASSGTSQFTLVTASSALGTYSTDLVKPENGATLSSVLTLDSSAANLMSNSFGESGTIRTWAPGWGAGRCIGIATSSYSDSPVYIVGRDAYGFKISEAVSISSNGSATSSYGGISQKAFKFIEAAYNSTTPTSTGIAIGTTDRFGFPLYVPYYGGDITVRLSSGNAVQNAVIALSTGNAILGMASTGTATSTTADVRGVYISSTALAGAYRLQISVTPAASAVAAISVSNLAPLFGATQYSSV